MIWHHGGLDILSDRRGARDRIRILMVKLDAVDRLTGIAGKLFECAANISLSLMTQRRVDGRRSQESCDVFRQHTRASSDSSL